MIEKVGVPQGTVLHVRSIRSAPRVQVCAWIRRFQAAQPHHGLSPGQMAVQEEGVGWQLPRQCVKARITL